jgi:hypothetical protein
LKAVRSHLSRDSKEKKNRNKAFALSYSAANKQQHDQPSV